uniref:Uncharacterized protein n=1 Tax=Amphiprion percula TaxID=161767 RepID=A0A3P8TGV4_AMPPE
MGYRTPSVVWRYVLADHIDNITYTLQGFANETIRGFGYLSNTQRSHRLTLLKHDMALDYILARQGGLCVALNLTGDACYTLVPDTSDNITIILCWSLYAAKTPLTQWFIRTSGDVLWILWVLWVAGWVLPRPG